MYWHIQAVGSLASISTLHRRELHFPLYGLDNPAFVLVLCRVLAVWSPL